MPICRNDMSCPEDDDTSRCLRDFLTQNRFHGAMLHDWYILNPKEKTQAGLRVKFNTMDKDTQKSTNLTTHIYSF